MRATADPTGSMASHGPRALSTRAWRIVAYSASLAFAISWTLALGRDLHWDAVNYHLYLGFSAVNDRFGSDFFAAGPPSYLNPYAYLPLYAMVAAEVPAIAMATILAAFHALILWVTFEIALTGGLRVPHRVDGPFAMLATLMAAMNPIFLQQVGATAIDISTGVLVMAGWLALAIAVRNGEVRFVAMAGALCGVGAALKLSNAVFAVGAIAALAFMPGSLRSCIRAVVAFVGTCALAFVLVAGPWAWQLWREFGNPVFPFYNQWFGSPDFTTEPLRYERFMPKSWVDFGIRPVTLASSGRMVQTEDRAPDIRYVALVAALVALAIFHWRRSIDGDGSPPGGRSELQSAQSASRRVFACLLTGFGVAWCLWLALSGNGRYFLPMACVASVILALALQRLFLLARNGTTVAILVILVVQTVQIAVATDWRRAGLSWQGKWMPVEVPQRFRETPHLFLSAHFLSASAFAPYLHPASGMMNITGFNPLGPDQPGGRRAQALIERHASRVRILVPLPNGYVEGAALPGPVDSLTLHVRRFGLRVDGSDCALLKVEGNLRATIRRSADPHPWTYFLTCRLDAAPELALAYAAEVRAADIIFDRVEAVCPNLFHPRGPLTEQRPFWVRIYNMGTEMQLWIEEGSVKYFNPLGGGDPIDIGTVEAWQQGPQPIDCTKRTSPALVARP